MGFFEYFMIVLVILLLAGVAYYLKVINGFKKFIQFEAEIKKNPSDEGVRKYIEYYKKTYIPDQPKIKASRSAFYRVIKASPNVSYEVKKELRNFFEKKEIVVMTTMKNDVSEGIEE